MLVVFFKFYKLLVDIYKIFKIFFGFILILNAYSILLCLQKIKSAFFLVRTFFLFWMLIKLKFFFIFYVLSFQNVKEHLKLKFWIKYKCKRRITHFLKTYKRWEMFTMKCYKIYILTLSYKTFCSNSKSNCFFVESWTYVWQHIIFQKIT